jgi:hypothetical protein
MGDIILYEIRSISGLFDRSLKIKRLKMFELEILNFKTEDLLYHEAEWILMLGSVHGKTFCKIMDKIDNWNPFLKTLTNLILTPKSNCNRFDCFRYDCYNEKQILICFKYLLKNEKFKNELPSIMPLLEFIPSTIPWANPFITEVIDRVKQSNEFSRYLHLIDNNLLFNYAYMESDSYLYNYLRNRGILLDCINYTMNIYYQLSNIEHYVEILRNIYSLPETVIDFKKILELNIINQIYHIESILRADRYKLHCNKHNMFCACRTGENQLVEKIWQNIKGEPIAEKFCYKLLDFFAFRIEKPVDTYFIQNDMILEKLFTRPWFTKSRYLDKYDKQLFKHFQLLRCIVMLPEIYFEIITKIID